MLLRGSLVAHVSIRWHVRLEREIICRSERALGVSKEILRKSGWVLEKIGKGKGSV